MSNDTTTGRSFAVPGNPGTITKKRLLKKIEVLEKAVTKEFKDLAEVLGSVGAAINRLEVFVFPLVKLLRNKGHLSLPELSEISATLRDSQTLAAFWEYIETPGDLDTSTEVSTPEDDIQAAVEETVWESEEESEEESEDEPEEPPTAA